MSLQKTLEDRSGYACELCTATENLTVYEVPPKENKNDYETILICENCLNQVEGSTEMDVNHWRCLNTSMWSEIPGVQVVAWRMLSRLNQEGWARDLLDMLYLDEETLEWAKATGEGIAEEDKIVHKDSNGALLEAGDSVVLIKDLNVKGAGFTAKRGTAVRNITLVHDNAEHIEGRVNGQQIVILTQYVKKS